MSDTTMGSIGLVRFFGRCGSLLSLLAVYSCDASSVESSGRPGQVRDSTGIMIVEHASIPPDLPSWNVGPPSVRIGALDGPDPDVFGRVSGITERSDGGVMVADALALQVKAFDREGQYLWTAGRGGDGPGEFRTLQYVLALPGDSVLALDLFGRRVVVFDSQGTYQRQFGLRLPDGAVELDSFEPMVVGVLTSGMLVATHLHPPAPAGPIGSRHRASPLLALYGPEGTIGEVLGRFPVREIVFTQPSPELTALGIGGASQQTVTMGSETVYAAAGERVAVGVQDRFEVAQYDADGALTMILRVSIPPGRVDRARFVSHGLSEIEDRDRRERTRQEREAAILPDQLPAFGRILLDAEGGLWVEEFVPSYEEHPTRWFVFGSDGALLATMTFPDDFRPFEIRAGRVLGLWRDALDVPYVEIRPFNR